ncbi:hypothetical protein KJ766_02250 [Patescibacteria group bacterium]|nr:hypothetical protein [Patescibacteria group bacterium]
MNRKNISSIILFVCIVLGIIYLRQMQNGRSEEYLDDVSELLTGAQQALDVEGEIIESNFEWNVGGEKNIEVTGKKFEKGDLLGGVSELFSYLEGRGFVTDVYNVSSGTIFSMTGMRVDDLLCLVNEEIKLDDNGVPVPSGAMKVVVKCGETKDSLNVEDVLQNILKDLFAVKYNVQNSAILVSIEKRQDFFIKGSAQILDELIDAETGEVQSGDIPLFFAKKSDQEWKIVFEGDRDYLCSVIIDYEFPGDMIEDCSEDSDEE